MDINEVREKKRTLETKLAQAINAEIEEFNADTGFSAERISIDMVDVSTVADRMRGRAEYVLGGVRVELEDI